MQCEGTSVQENVESRCRHSMGDVERWGKMLWALLADFLSRALQGIACFLSISLSVFLSVSCQATRWSAMEEDGDGDR